MRSLLFKSFCFLYTFSLLRRVTFVDCHKSNQKDAFHTAHLETENPICGEKSDFRLRCAYNRRTAKTPSQSDKSANCSLLGMCLSSMFYIIVKLCLFSARGFFAQTVRFILSQSLMQRWQKPCLLQNIKISQNLASSISLQPFPAKDGKQRFSCPRKQ